MTTSPAGRARSFAAPPVTAACRHDGSGRTGVEVVFLATTPGQTSARGHTAAVEDDATWAVGYEIAVGPDWVAQRARIRSTSADGDRVTGLRHDGSGRWWVDGIRRPDLDGCLDVDLEGSACTNTFAVHRLALDAGDASEAPAAYVRAGDGRVERLEQRYRRLDDDGDRSRFAYQAPAFGVECELVLDRSGLVLDYPDLARRIG